MSQETSDMSSSSDSVSRMSSGELRTVQRVFLFSDLENSTKMKSVGGNNPTAKLFFKQDQLCTELLKHYHGIMEERTGDGFLCSFDRHSDAVSFSVEFLRRLREIKLTVRVAIHSGEVSLFPRLDARPQLCGVAVDLASRVLELARGGRILMTRQVFDDARINIRAAQDGTALRWESFGPYRFKGIDYPAEVCEVLLDGDESQGSPRSTGKAEPLVSMDDTDVLGWRPALNLRIPNREDWILTTRLGSGGYGEVWLATNERTSVEHVFKFCFDRERIRGLKREAALFKILKDRLGYRDDIAKVLDWNFEQNPFYIESEFTSGGDLLQWADRVGISTVSHEQRMQVAIRAAKALHAAHSAGVLHKDIKASNILVDMQDAQDLRIRLTDFGIGSLVEPLQGVLPAGLTTLGTLHNVDSTRTGTRIYMAPECLEGHRATVASDIYSLGVLLYQLACGDLRRALRGVGWEHDVADRALQAIIRRCVHGNPEQRYVSAAALAADLEYLYEPTVVARRRRRFWASAALASTSVAAAALVLMLWTHPMLSGRMASKAKPQQVASPVAKAANTAAVVGASDTPAPAAAAAPDPLKGFMAQSQNVTLSDEPSSSVASSATSSKAVDPAKASALLAGLADHVVQSTNASTALQVAVRGASHFGSEVTSAAVALSAESAVAREQLRQAERRRAAETTAARHAAALVNPIQGRLISGIRGAVLANRTAEQSATGWLHTLSTMVPPASRRASQFVNATMADVERKSAKAAVAAAMTSATLATVVVDEASTKSTVAAAADATTSGLVVSSANGESSSGVVVQVNPRANDAANAGGGNRDETPAGGNKITAVKRRVRPTEVEDTGGDDAHPPVGRTASKASAGGVDVRTGKVDRGVRITRPTTSNSTLGSSLRGTQRMGIATSSKSSE